MPQAMLDTTHQANGSQIQSPALTWFISYSSDHLQCVAVNEAVSNNSKEQYGVPQGSDTKTIAFHTLHVTLGNSALYFFTAQRNIPIRKTNE